MRVAARILLAALAAAPASAQSPAPGGLPPPPGMDLARSAAMRFPQPVRVGDLIGRAVLRPVEGQDVLGTLQEVVRTDDGSLAAVVAFGGLLGFGRRLIAVPLDAMVLLGDATEVVAFTPEQLRAFPSYAPGAATALPADAVVRVGLAKPSH